MTNTTTVQGFYFGWTISQIDNSTYATVTFNDYLDSATVYRVFRDGDDMLICNNDGDVVDHFSSATVNKSFGMNPVCWYDPKLPYMYK